MSRVEVSRCAHCRRRLRDDRLGVGCDDDGEEWYCTRRACRRAWSEAAPGGPSGLPFTVGGLGTETLGAGLIAVDYVRLPWWARPVPRSWMDGLLRDAAVQIGGAVQRSVQERTAPTGGGR